MGFGKKKKNSKRYTGYPIGSMDETLDTCRIAKVFGFLPSSSFFVCLFALFLIFVFFSFVNMVNGGVCGIIAALLFGFN